MWWQKKEGDKKKGDGMKKLAMLIGTEGSFVSSVFFVFFLVFLAHEASVWQQCMWFGFFVKQQLQSKTWIFLLFFFFFFQAPKMFGIIKVDWSWQLIGWPMVIAETDVGYNSNNDGRSKAKKWILSRIKLFSVCLSKSF